MRLLHRIFLVGIFLTFLSLIFFEQLSFLFQLFLTFLLLLPFQTFLECELLCRFYLFCASAEEFLSHFLLPISLFGLEFEVTFIISLSSVGIISKTGSGHGGGDIFYFLDCDSGKSVVSEFHLCGLKP